MKYLDTNIIVYAIENNPTYGEPCKKIMENIENNKLTVCCSFLVLVEIINVLQKINKSLLKENKAVLNIRANIDAILSLPIVWFDIGFLIIKKASEYSYNVSGVDYIHIATMELNSISEVISLDEELDRVWNIKRIVPEDI